MGVRCRVDDDAVVDASGFLDGIHQVSLMVGLKNAYGLETGLRPCRVAEVLEVVVGLRSVYARFTDPQHVEVGTVEHQDVHGFSLFRTAVRRF